MTFPYGTLMKFAKDFGANNSRRTSKISKFEFGYKRIFKQTLKNQFKFFKILFLGKTEINLVNSQTNKNQSMNKKSRDMPNLPPILC
jgi:hypothetical protein